jgi:hypothetical protein
MDVMCLILCAGFMYPEHTKPALDLELNMRFEANEASS